MKHRARAWSSFGRLKNADGIGQQFERGAFAVFTDDSGWWRLRVTSSQRTDDRRSWALDPGREREATWTAVTVPPAVERAPTTATSIVNFVDGDVEGEINPHADTRGRVRQSVSLTRCQLPFGAPGSGTRGDSRYEPGLAICLGHSDGGLRIDLPLAAEARVYGLGEKTGGLDKRGHTWSFWNTDEPLQLPTRDPLYQSIPVAYLKSSHGVMTVFSDSPAQQYFDVGESDAGSFRIEAYDSQVDIYLRWDTALPDAVRAYGKLTGRMPLPPIWALGFHQCRYSYPDEPRVLAVAERMRRERVPCDVLYLDIHYMDGYRVFTWDPDRFPDPRRLVDTLKAQGFRVVVIVNPGVKVDPGFEVYQDGTEQDVYLRRTDGSTYVGVVWPGAAAYPDFTDQTARAWWTRHLATLLDLGVAGIWNDMNEPSDFSGDRHYRCKFTVPDDLRARNDGREVDLGALHNVYANGMNGATREAFARLDPRPRGFVLTRAGYAGVQRHAAVWTGDNHSWWEHLAMSIPMHLGLSLSGVPFCGADTGGFQLNASPELFTRWVAASCLMPFFRVHSALDTLDHEPWSFGAEALDAVRAFIELRYQLLPYLYTLTEAACTDGTPVIRPLFWDWPDDPRVANRGDSFMLGDALLVAPVRERGVQERSVYLPAGGWYDFWSGEYHLGPKSVIADAPLDRLPLFQRAGSIVPYECVRQHTNENGDGVLHLLVAPSEPGNASAKANGRLYVDDGDGMAYLSGAYWRADVQLAADSVHIVTIGGGLPTDFRWTHAVAHRVGCGLGQQTPERRPLEARVTAVRVD
jgi:alpha-glucosidase